MGGAIHTLPAKTVDTCSIHGGVCLQVCVSGKEIYFITAQHPTQSCPSVRLSVCPSLCLPPAVDTFDYLTGKHPFQFAAFIYQAGGHAGVGSFLPYCDNMEKFSTNINFHGRTCKAFGMKIN